jgi:hypothetical protein
MYRSLLRRKPQRVLFSIGILLSAGCGGNDVIDSVDGSGDATFESGAFDAVSDPTLADRPNDTASGDTGPDARDAGPDADAAVSDAAGLLDTGPAPDVVLVDSPGLFDAESGLLDAPGLLDAEGGLVDGADAGGVDAGGMDAAGLDGGDAEAGSEGGIVIAPPSLGTARTFAVLAGMTITNTGVTTAIVGDVGISPGTALVGLTAGQVTGTIYLGGAVAMQAEADLTTAYNNLSGRPCTHDMTSIDLGGKTLPPGVYCFASSAAQMVGDLTLDGVGDPNAVWIFQIASTLTISTNLSTVMIRSGNACNVYWQVGSSATINGGAQFKGNILAQASISLLTGANVSPGRTLAQTAAVTMQSSAISNAGCP